MRSVVEIRKKFYGWTEWNKQEKAKKKAVLVTWLKRYWQEHLVDFILYFLKELQSFYQITQNKLIN